MVSNTRTRDVLVPDRNAQPRSRPNLQTAEVPTSRCQPLDCASRTLKVTIARMESRNYKHQCGLAFLSPNPEYQRGNPPIYHYSPHFIGFEATPRNRDNMGQEVHIRRQLESSEPKGHRAFLLTFLEECLLPYPQLHPCPFQFHYIYTISLGARGQRVSGICIRSVYLK